MIYEGEKHSASPLTMCGNPGHEGTLAVNHQVKNADGGDSDTPADT